MKHRIHKFALLLAALLILSLTAVSASAEETVVGEELPEAAPVSTFGRLLTLEDFDVIPDDEVHAASSYLNPQTIRPTSSLYGFSWISNRTGSGYRYPFTATFTLTADTMPQNSVYLAVKNYDCDELGNSSCYEYDQVYINGNLVGVLTGNNNTSNTTLLKVDRSFLKKGVNEIEIYVGNVYRNYPDVVLDDGYWVLRVDDIQLVCDGGTKEGLPDTFNVNLTNAVVSGSNVNCYVTTEIKDSKKRKFELEYALYDWSDPASSTYGQIIDDHFSTISSYYAGKGTTNQATLTIPKTGKSGTYTAVVYLKVYENGKYSILAYDEESFEYKTGVAPAFHIQNLKAVPADLTPGVPSVKLDLSADINPAFKVENPRFYISDSLQCAGSIDSDGHITGEITLYANGFYTVELRYTVDGKAHTKKTTVEVNNLSGHSGWLQENGKWIYLVSGQKLVNAWVQDTKGWCYVGADGYMVTNCWLMDSVGWCYVGSDGYILTNYWVSDNGKWYYLNQDGRLASNTKVYVDFTGAMTPLK